MTTTGFLALISLKKVLQEPGCPICRLSQEKETRYVINLLRENVNDVGTRGLISESMGFCPQHMWLMYRLETERFGVPLGTAIIFADLGVNLS